MSEIFDSKPETLKHIRRVQELMHSLTSELISRGIHHDASKLTEPELPGWDQATHHLEHVEYGSEEYKAGLRAIKPVVELHYSKNRHHPEHFGDRGVNGMTLVDLVEMLCDWKAASERGKGNDFFANLPRTCEKYDIDDQLFTILQNTALEGGW